MHCFLEKLEYNFRADDILVKLFNLEQSFKFIQEMHSVQMQIGEMVSAMIKQEFNNEETPGVVNDASQ